jgi:hypothetical protein
MTPADYRRVKPCYIGWGRFYIRFWPNSGFVFSWFSRKVEYSISKGFRVIKRG